jgi:hypothetical protein
MLSSQRRRCIPLTCSSWRSLFPTYQALSPIAFAFFLYRLLSLVKVA